MERVNIGVLLRWREMIKKCAFCGNKFSTHHPLYKYCSDKCRREGTRQHHLSYKRLHRKEWNEKMKLKRQEERMTVLKHYSNGTPTCACCDESHIEFLELDHTNNNGAEHRKKIGRTTIYSWVIKNNFPEGFQVLCANCNQSRGRYGYCPHTKEA